MNDPTIENDIAWAEISLSAIANNSQIIRQCSQQAKVIAVLKASAYGHGAEEIAPYIDADAFAVARFEEAISLRKNGISKPIIILSPLINDNAIDLSLKFNLDLVVYSQSAAEFLLQSPHKNPINLWVKIDTGMHRLGLAPSAALTLLPKLIRQSSLNIISLMSHFSSSDEVNSDKTARQLSIMANIAQQFPTLGACLANSCATFFSPESHFEWVRAGIMLYGINPSPSTNTLTDNLIPAMSLKARILDSKPIKKGDYVGYNCRWRAKKDTQIATIGVGYGDGYPRHAPSGTPVWINGKIFPLAGTVSMDLITVDTGNTNIKPGDVAVLWGKELSVSTIAEHANTIAYELVTRLNQRVKRIYINDPSGKLTQTMSRINNAKSNASV